MSPLIRAVLLALIAAPVEAQITLRRTPPPPMVEDNEDYLLAGVEEDELCHGNEMYCTEGSEFHEWVSTNCPETCAVFLDESRTGDLRADCEIFQGHCDKDNEDGVWVRTYCSKTCERQMEYLAGRPSAVSEMVADNPAAIMALTLAALVAYIKKLQNAHKTHQC